MFLFKSEIKLLHFQVVLLHYFFSTKVLPNINHFLPVDLARDFRLRAVNLLVWIIKFCVI